MLAREQPKPYSSALLRVLSKIGLGGWLESMGRDALQRGTVDSGEDIRTIRKAQTKQFEYPNSHALTPSKYRPTDLTKFQDQAFKSVMDYFPNFIDMSKSVKMPTTADLIRSQKPFSLPDDKVYGFGGLEHPEGAYRESLTSDAAVLRKILGLGHATMSLGYDKERKQPYMSVFDSWDFKGSPAVTGPNRLGFDIINALGKPFNIYDRVYIPKPKNELEPLNSSISVPKESLVGDVYLPTQGRK
jgi:hypothetical protein